VNLGDTVMMDEAQKARKLARIYLAISEGRPVYVDDSEMQPALNYHAFMWIKENIDHLRIDPETTPPDIVRNCFAVPDHMVATFDHIHDTWKHNLILTWDGETKDLISAQVVK